MLTKLKIFGSADIMPSEIFKFEVLRFMVVNSFRIACTCLLALIFGWFVSGFTQQTRSNRSSLTSAHHAQNYFSTFKGFAECNIRVDNLYILPPKDQRGFHAPDIFCHDRKRLLEALSGGGRVGFDAPYQSRGNILKYSSQQQLTDPHRLHLPLA